MTMDFSQMLPKIRGFFLGVPLILDCNIFGVYVCRSRFSDTPAPEGMQLYDHLGGRNEESFF